MADISGGDKLTKALGDISRRLGRGGSVKVGFLSNARYPDGTPVAMIAAIQDFGAPAVGIPPRPFFRNMIAAKSPEWPVAIETNLKATNYDVDVTLARLGEGIAGQLRQSIVDTNEPALKQVTIDRKGFSKPLVDTGMLLGSVDYETSSGSRALTPKAESAARIGLTKQIEQLKRR